jgi:hypothetical protein
MVLKMLRKCVMIPGSRLRNHLAHSAPSFVGSLEATDVPNAFHAVRWGRETRKGTDGSMSSARQCSLCLNVDVVRHSGLAQVDGVPEALHVVKECEVSARG